MTIALDSIGQLSDRDLLTCVQRAAVDERHATAHLIALLTEVDARRLYLGEGCSSLFTYCTQVLHLSEQAYGRIEAARAARRFPVILERLEAGAVTLTTIGLLARHLTSENYLDVLEAARHKTKREVEQLVAHLDPKPDVPPVVRKCPPPKTAVARARPLPETPPNEDRGPSTSTSRDSSSRPVVKPLAPERYKVQFTIGRDAYERLRRVQDLMRHTIPNGDPGLIFDRALTLLLDELSKTKVAAVERPRASRATARGSRHIPAAVKRQVWKRDGGQCAFRGPRGRCTETGFLEFHHVVPFADGGKMTSDNLELRCRAHNAYEADRWFGARHPSLLRDPRVAYG